MAVELFSPGAEAELQEKDVVVSIDGTKVNTIGELRKYLYKKTTMGTSVEMKLYRDGQQRTIALKMRGKGINQ